MTAQFTDRKEELDKLMNRLEALEWKINVLLKLENSEELDNSDDWEKDF